MKLQARWALLSVALLVAAAAWASITTDYAHNVNFINFKTFPWGKLETGNSIWDERTQSAVDSALAAKAGPEFPLEAIFWSMRSEKPILSTRMNTFYDGFGGG